MQPAFGWSHAPRAILLRTCARVDVNHRDQQQDVDLVVQLDDQLLDVGVLDLPPREVVVGRVDEIRTPGERFLTFRITYNLHHHCFASQYHHCYDLLVAIANITIALVPIIIIVMSYLSPSPQNLHMVCSDPCQSTFFSRSQ